MSFEYVSRLITQNLKLITQQYGFHTQTAYLPHRSPHPARKCPIIRRHRKNCGNRAKAGGGGDSKLSGRFAVASRCRVERKDSDARRNSLDATAAFDT